MTPITELLKATEAAAIATAPWIGTGDKINADKAATEAMRRQLNQAPLLSAHVVIGEGKKDQSYGLFDGEQVGGAAGSKITERYDLAVDPIEGTRPVVTSGPEALSVIAVGDEKSFFKTDAFYMLKLAYGYHIARKTTLDLSEPLERIIQKVTAVTDKKNENIVVCLLDRPRHKHWIEQLRALRVRIKLIQDCDISASIATCLPESGIDLVYGVGGAPEAVITACAMKCLRGGFQAQVAGADGTSIPDAPIHDIGDLVKSECGFSATGITNGSLLRGIRYTTRGPVTNSVIMDSKTGDVRWLTTYHGA